MFTMHLYLHSSTIKHSAKETDEEHSSVRTPSSPINRTQSMDIVDWWWWRIEIINQWVIPCPLNVWTRPQGRPCTAWSSIECWLCAIVLISSSSLHFMRWCSRIAGLLWQCSRNWVLKTLPLKLRYNLIVKGYHCWELALTQSGSRIWYCHSFCNIL